MNFKRWLNLFNLLVVNFAFAQTTDYVITYSDLVHLDKKEKLQAVKLTKDFLIEYEKNAKENGFQKNAPLTERKCMIAGWPSVINDNGRCLHPSELNSPEAKSLINKVSNKLGQDLSSIYSESADKYKSLLLKNNEVNKDISLIQASSLLGQGLEIKIQHSATLEVAKACTEDNAIICPPEIFGLDVSDPQSKKLLCVNMDANQGEFTPSMVCSAAQKFFQDLDKSDQYDQSIINSIESLKKSDAMANSLKSMYDTCLCSEDKKHYSYSVTTEFAQELRTKDVCQGLAQSTSDIKNNKSDICIQCSHFNPDELISTPLDPKMAKELNQKINVRYPKISKTDKKVPQISLKNICPLEKQEINEDPDFKLEYDISQDKDNFYILTRIVSPTGKDVEGAEMNLFPLKSEAEVGNYELARVGDDIFEYKYTYSKKNKDREFKLFGKTVNNWSDEKPVTLVDDDKEEKPDFDLSYSVSLNEDKSKFIITGTIASLTGKKISDPEIILGPKSGEGQVRQVGDTNIGELKASAVFHYSVDKKDKVPLMISGFVGDWEASKDVDLDIKDQEEDENKPEEETNSCLAILDLNEDNNSLKFTYKFGDKTYPDGKETQPKGYGISIKWFDSLLGDPSEQTEEVIVQTKNTLDSLEKEEKKEKEENKENEELSAEEHAIKVIEANMRENTDEAIQNKITNAYSFESGQFTRVVAVTLEISKDGKVICRSADSKTKDRIQRMPGNDSPLRLQGGGTRRLRGSGGVLPGQR